MAEMGLVQHLSEMNRRIGAIEEEASNPDSITLFDVVFGNLKVTMTPTTSRYKFRFCSHSTPEAPVNVTLSTLVDWQAGSGTNVIFG